MVRMVEMQNVQVVIQIMGMGIYQVQETSQITFVVFAVEQQIAMEIVINSILYLEDEVMEDLEDIVLPLSQDSNLFLEKGRIVEIQDKVNKDL